MASIPVIPNSVAAGAEVDIFSATAINRGPGGNSGRLSVTPPKRRFICTVGPNDVPAVRSIYYTHKNRWPCGIRDWGDFIFEDEELVYAAGDDSNWLAPLRRLIRPAPGSRYYHQRVLLPDESDDDFPVVIKVDGTPLDREVWEFNNFGIASVPTAYIPSGGVLTWSGRAFVPVVFSDQTLSIQINVKQQTAIDFGIQSIPSVTFEELFETELIELMLETDESL